jgi:integrase/recombinase XerD
LRAERRIADTLNGEQVAAIAAACDRLRDRFLFSLLASSGLRVGEAWGCATATLTPRLGWCRWCRGSMRIGLEPRAEVGRCRCPGAVIRLYADYLHGEYGELDSDYVFVNLWSGPIGCPLTYASVYDLVCRLRDRTGIMFGPHTFRHSYATELLRRKVPVEVVAHLLGHASIATTSDAYAHLKVEDARRALVAAGWLAARDGSW